MKSITWSRTVYKFYSSHLWKQVLPLSRKHFCGTFHRGDDKLCFDISKDSRSTSKFLSHFTPTEQNSPGRTVEDVCNTWAQKFEVHSIPECRLSVEYIVAFVLGHKTLHGINKAKQITPEQLIQISAMCQQRLTHMPIQYILGEWDFWNLTLTLRPPVFIPRTETEELVRMVVKHVETNGDVKRSLELGCGSGAITLSLLNSFPQATAVAVDVSPDACNLTQENAERLGLANRLTVVQADFSHPDGVQQIKKLSPFDLLISNPPYIPTADLLTLEHQILGYEDHRALDGGNDGLDLIKMILKICPHILSPGSNIWLEVDPDHPIQIQDIVSHSSDLALKYVTAYRDYLGRERFCHLQMK